MIQLSSSSKQKTAHATAEPCILSSEAVWLSFLLIVAKAISRLQIMQTISRKLPNYAALCVHFTRRGSNGPISFEI